MLPTNCFYVRYIFEGVQIINWGKQKKKGNFMIFQTHKKCHQINKQSIH